MGKQPPGDAKSIAICAAVLWRLGCPNLRPCQGDPELVKTIRTATYRRTPDLVAGPIRGHGSPHDFFIDVAELQGETLYNPRRKGGTAPPAMLVDPAHNHGTLDAADMPTNHFDGYLSTLNGKLRKYSGERENSPMVGLCVHLDASAMKSGATLGPGDLMRFITRIDYLRFLNAVFGAAGGSVLDEALDRMMPGAQPVASVVFLPSPYRFAFLCHSIQTSEPEAGGISALLIVNDNLLDEESEFRDHPVLRWLRGLRAHAETRPA